MTAEKKISQYLKLKDNHPTMVKLAKLAEVAEDLGISISFGHYQAHVHDRDRDESLPPLVMEELDGGEAIGEWPPIFEYKVIYDNPAYLAQQKAEREEYDRKRKEEEDKRESERKAKEDAEKARRAKAEEQRERAELARLKAKYND